MVSGHLTTPRGSKAAGRRGGLRCLVAGALAGLGALLLPLALPLAAATATPTSAPCTKPVYLTFDTGHMGVAPLVAEVLRRHQVPVTFFIANERTQSGGSSLDAQWAPWWRERVAEGHDFASHTWDHGYWEADLPPDAQGQPRFRIRQTFGPQAGQRVTWTAAQYCEELRRPARWLRETAQKPMLPLFRAPGGKTSPALVAAARACGFEHVPWTAAGFLGDELPSDRYPNAALLQRALRDIRAGDILLAHLGIWSRQDPWAPAVLEPLITGLKSRGLCFAPLREHPRWREWIARTAPPA